MYVQPTYLPYTHPRHYVLRPRPRCEWMGYDCAMLVRPGPNSSSRIACRACSSAVWLPLKSQDWEGTYRETGPSDPAKKKQKHNQVAIVKYRNSNPHEVEGWLAGWLAPR